MSSLRQALFIPTCSSAMASSLWVLTKVALIRIIVQIYKVVVDGVFALIYSGRGERVPEIRDPLLLQSATSLAEKIRKGKVKSEDVVGAYIARIREVQRSINAVTDERFQEALDESRAADRLVASGRKTEEELLKEMPLLGIPFSCKHLIGVKGMKCTAGSMIFKDLRAKEDSEVASLLKRAGAIAMVMTNTSEMALGFESANRLHGRTNNPYNTARTPGGSSGGEGALIASAGSVIGIGNDLAGSIRLPSLWTGIFGHKPSRGVVSNRGIFPLPDEKTLTYLTSGPMCRYAVDLITTLKVIAGKKADSMKLDAPVNFQRLKIYYMYDDGGNPFVSRIHPELLEAQRKVTEYFKSKYDLHPKEVHLKNLRHSFKIWSQMLQDSVSRPIRQIVTGGKKKLDFLTELWKWFQGQSAHSFSVIMLLNLKNSIIYSEKGMPLVRELCEQLDNEFEAMLDDTSVFLYPTFPDVALYHNQSNLRIIDTSYMSIFNILGMPVTQCPLGLNSQGLPLGIQVIGCRGNDRLTLAVAVELEKAFGGWVPPTPHVQHNGPSQKSDDVDCAVK